ncbi:hypothetical protein T265_03588 [Opisthorchis viverrini]|uniref:Uncharacterized protein n=1 Tax=Opisthorchis viverrini TaxID=6198 RepID=A0A075AHH6_OPIVI|nr:hypothetical protein T265_03588 [Opisthorchis viverrini]KER29899.1 hypothetical protein T265_03588 [Opisthorchis viverrini]
MSNQLRREQGRFQYSNRLFLMTIESESVGHLPLGDQTSPELHTRIGEHKRSINRPPRISGANQRFGNGRGSRFILLKNVSRLSLGSKHSNCNKEPVSENIDVGRGLKIHVEALVAKRLDFIVVRWFAFLNKPMSCTGGLPYSIHRVTYQVGNWDNGGQPQLHSGRAFESKDFGDDEDEEEIESSGEADWVRPSTLSGSSRVRRTSPGSILSAAEVSMRLSILESINSMADDLPCLAAIRSTLAL